MKPREEKVWHRFGNRGTEGVSVKCEYKFHQSIKKGGSCFRTKLLVRQYVRRGRGDRFRLTVGKETVASEQTNLPVSLPDRPSALKRRRHLLRPRPGCASSALFKQSWRDQTTHTSRPWHPSYLGLLSKCGSLHRCYHCHCGGCLGRSSAAWATPWRRPRIRAFKSSDGLGCAHFEPRVTAVKLGIE